MKKLLHLALVFLPYSVYANEAIEENEIQIVQINPIRNQAILKSSRILKIGDELIVTNTEGKQCAIIVTNTISLISEGEMPNCGIISSFTISDTVTPYMAPKVETKKEENIDEKRTSSTPYVPSNIKKSIEFSILKFSDRSVMMQTNNITDNFRDYKETNDETSIKSFPLAFKVEAENDSFGLIADLDFKDDQADFAFYGKSNQAKFGGGLQISYLKETDKATALNKMVTDSSTQSRLISPYLYFKINMQDNESSKIDFWTKAGVGFVNNKADDTELDYRMAYINPGIDIFFKTGKDVSVGFGADAGYAGLEGTLKSGNVEKEGNGSITFINIEILKIKYEF